MGSSRQVIRIDAEVNASLGNLNQVVTQLREGHSNGATQIDMSKGIGKSISGLIRTFQTEYDEFSRLTKNGVLNMDDSGPAITSAKKLLRVFDELQDVMSGIESKDANALKKLFPSGFDENISNLGKELDKVGQKIKNLSTAKAQKLGLEEEVERLQTELEQLKSKIAEPDQLDLNVQQAEQRLQRINKLIEDMRARAGQKIKINLEGQKEIKEKEHSNLLAQQRTKQEEVDRAQAEFNQTWRDYKIRKNKDGRYTYDGRTQADWESQIKTGSESERDIARKAVKSLQNIDIKKHTRFEEASTSLNTKKQELAALETRIQTISSEISNLQSSVAGLGNLSLGVLTELGKQAGLSPEQIERISKALQMQTTAQERLNQAQQAQADLPENQQAAEQKTADIEAKKKQIIDLEKTISGLKEKLDLSDLSKRLSELGIDISPDLLKSEEGAQQVREQLEKLDKEKLASVKKALQDLGITSKETQKNAEGAAKGIGKMDDEVRAVTRAEQDMENLKNRMLDFFSLTNTIQLFKRAVTQAFNTVKELDAVMTETAVVTDFSVGDMWDKLPEYSAEANKLGASISSLYQATTLYYQQGLETQAAMGVGIETMKMARIAGMEATEATQAMTAALRGFNMEVNEMNATRVNDVYSELAAITAADTEQIATAMTKTASIAASANMEFETTAALLAQIIETTQEAPETAGTAMKTIIARFTEVKSLFSEGQLTGKDEEGEAIDINKIDKALSSVGISLKDFLKGQKGIDDIFLELASKWDTLDLATQRYIATTAAGSRQQSRFIAMMSDYGRTMELVSAANNSAGASQRQFDKTQESLEAKLQKLKNAWDQFTMGIANSDLIKGGVDMLTKILNVINTLIDKLSMGSGLIKGILSLGAAWGGLALGNKALSGGLKFLTNNTIFGDIMPNLKKSLNEIPKDAEKPAVKTAEVFKRALGGIKKMLSSPTFWGVAAAVAVVAIITKLLDNAIETEKEKYERLQKQVEYSKDTEKSVRATKSMLEADTKNLKNLEKGFEKLNRGTIEWKEQLLQANNQVIDMVEKYKGLELATGIFGQLTITEDSYQKVIEQQTKRAVQLQSASYIASAELASMNFDNWRDEEVQEQLQEYNYDMNLVTNQGKEIQDLAPVADLEADEAIKYISPLIEAGINSTNLSENKEKITDILIREGYTGSISNLIDNLENLGGDFDILGSKALDTALKIETMERGFYANVASQSENRDLTNTAKENYLDYYYQSSGGLVGRSEEIENQIKEQSPTKILAQYADAMGYEYYGGKIYTDSTMTQTIDLGEDQEQQVNIAASVLAQMQLNDESVKLLDSLSLSSDQQKAFEIYFGDSSSLNAQQFQDYNDINKLAGVLGLTEDDLYVDKEKGQVTRKYLELQEILDERRKAIAENEKEQLSYFIKYSSQALFGGDIQGAFETYENAIPNYTQTYGEKFEENLLSVMRAITQTKDEEISKKVFDSLLNTENQEAFVELSDFISNIDWSNPIMAADEIKTAMETGTPAVKTMAEEIFNLGQGFLGAGSQIRYFVESSSFSEVNSELQEIIEKNGKISAADVLDLADDYEALGKIIDNTNLSAAGLAEILGKFSDGTLKIYQLTDAVLAAAEGFDSLDGVIAETLKSIDDFDPGLNETDVVDFSEKAYKALTENFKNGYWGNSQNFEYLDYFFGPKWREGLSGDDLKAEMQKLTNIIGEGDSGLQKAWQNILSGKTIRGGKSTFDLSSFETMTSKEATAALAEANGISEEYAGILLTYLKNIDLDFAAMMEKTDIEAGLQKAWMESNGTMDISELEALSEIYGESVEYLKQYYKLKGAIITQYRDENGQLKKTEALISQLNMVYGSKNWGITKDLDTGGNLFNTTEMRAAMLQEGFSETETNKVIQDAIAEQVEQYGEATVTEVLSSGHNVTFTVDKEKSYEQARWEEEQRIQQGFIAEIFGETIVSKLEESLTLTVETPTGEIVEFQAQLNGQEEAINTFLKLAEGTKITFQAGMKIPRSLITALEILNPTLVEQLLGAGLEIDESHASGLKNSPTTHDALVSEKGPELIQRADGTAYLSGLNGPEITKIHRGDTVYTAEETEQIFRNRGKTMPRFEYGLGNLSEEEVKKLISLGDVGTLQEVYKEYGEEGLKYYGYELNMTSSQQEFFDKYGYSISPYIKKNSDDNDGGASENKDKNDTTEIPDWAREALESLNSISTGLGGGSFVGSLVSEEKTSLDKLYNLLALIEETTRQRERLERRYEALIKDTDSSIKDVVDNSKAQLAVLEAEKELQESLIKGRQAQIEAYTAQNAGYAQYAGVETNAYGDQVMRIDWDAINAISNDDERKKVEEYVSKLEGWLDELTEAEDALWDIEDAVEEINERGKEEYLDLENQIKEALISERQEEIDKLSAIDESINNANSSMMQAIQDTLSQQRQERDNAKTEEELAEKERRLQYLKQDTSGANALEIMELEKELAEGREDYTDTLIDQKIEELQKQNDQAAEQRQKQIDILSKQLEMYERSEQIWKDVHNLINNGIDNDGIVIGSSLHNILKDYLATQGLSSIAKKDWWSDLDKTIKNAMAWLQTGRQLENLPDSLAGKTINFTVGDETLTGKVDENGNVTTEDGAVYKDVYEGAGGIYRTEEGKQSPPSTEQEPVKPTEPELPEWYSSLEKTQGFGYGAAKEDIAPVLQALDYLGYNGSGGYYFDPTNPKMGDAALLAMSAFQKANGLNASGVMWNTDKYGGSKELKDQGKKTFEALKKATKNKLGLTQFKTGGVADFTGPAWLDGTKSRPEIILNQQDSRNFIQLKDILGSILKGNHYSSSSTENNGDTVYDIDINVEKLEREVDLDTISNYVERKITETARYRNNNAVKISR